jgi:hypothetical protein
LTDLQRVILGPVVAIIRRHRQDRPITMEQIVGVVNLWLSSMFVHPNPYGEAVERDAQKAIQYYRNEPKSETSRLCSNGRGYYWAAGPGELEPYIHQLESRIKSIASNLRHARRCHKDMLLGEGTDAAVCPDLFDQQIDRLLSEAAACGNLLATLPAPDKPRGAGSIIESQTGEQI